MLILRLSKREDQALIPISTILKFSAQVSYQKLSIQLLESFNCCSESRRFQIWADFLFKLAHFNKIQYFPGISFLMFHKPFLGSLQIPNKIWARSVQPFWRVYKQKTNKHPHKQVYIDVHFVMREHVLAAFKY